MLLRPLFSLVTVFLSALTAAKAESFVLGEPRAVPAPGPELPIWGYVPDGHLSFYRAGEGWSTVWAGESSYISSGPDLLHQSGTRQVLHRGAKGRFDNGGAWLYNVFPTASPHWLGFYHAEDHEFSGDPRSTFIAWKSIALAHSVDGGVSWTPGTQIITAARAKPAKPQWGGNGDFCVVRDEKRQRWVCFYQDKFLCAAESTDPQAAPGTWKKWFRGEFSEPGLGGRNSPIPAFQTPQYWGANPSVHWNTFLERWVMVWHAWESGILWLSTSEDLENWTRPEKLLRAEKGQRLWYPTIFGQERGESDQRAGENAFLAYGKFPSRDKWERELVVRPIRFLKTHTDIANSSASPVPLN